MSNQLEFPIEKFLYNDECLKNDLSILELTSEKVRDEVIPETKTDEIITETKEIEIKEQDLWDNKIDGVIKGKEE